MELRQYAAVVWKWAWLIALCVLLAGSTAYVMSERQPLQYQATTTLLINPASSAVQDSSSLDTGMRLARTYAQLLTKRPVMEEVAATLGLDIPPDALPSKITVRLVPDTQLVTLQVVDGDPLRARDIANTVPAAFARQNEEMQLSRYKSSKENLQKELEAVNGDILSSQSRLDALHAATNPDPAELSRLEEAVMLYRTTYANLLRSYEDVRVAEARTLDTVTVAEPAVLPKAPMASKTRTNTVLAAVVGAMIAVMTGFLIEYLDDTVKSPEDVQRATQLPTLGAIVRFPRAETQAEEPIMAAQPKSGVAEGYRVLRTKLQFATMGIGKSGSLLLVTSAQPLEGKTTSLVNLGVSLAQGGKRVLLVDTDLRRPALHKQFGLQDEAGLTTLLLEPDADLERVVQPTAIEGLRVLVAGPLPANPAEVLDSPQALELLQRLRPQADYILLDSPPVLSVADASILAQKVDGVLMVVEMGKTRTDTFQRATAALQEVKARVIGAVLNKVSARPGGYYYYYYYSGYYTDEQGRKTQKKRRSQRGLRGAVARLFGRSRPAPAGQVRAQDTSARPSPEAAVGAQGRAAPASLAVDRVQGALPAVAGLPADVQRGQPISQVKRKGALSRAFFRLLVVMLIIAALATGALALIRLGWIVLPARPTGVQGYLNQGRAFFMIENYEEAIQQFNTALELAPDNGDAQLGLEKAQQYAQIKALYVESKALIEQNQCDLAIPNLEAVLKADPWYKDAAVLLARCQRSP